MRWYYGVIDGCYKLIYFYELDVNEWEFFDLVNDLYEFNSVYNNEEYFEVLVMMCVEFECLRVKYEVLMIDFFVLFWGGWDNLDLVWICEDK